MTPSETLLMELITIDEQIVAAYKQVKEDDSLIAIWDDIYKMEAAVAKYKRAYLILKEAEL